MDSRATLARLQGHSDFVKAIALSATHPVILASAAADASIIVWNTLKSTKLHVLKGHSRAVLCLAFDPLPGPAGTSSTLFSGSSDREIRKWKISSDTTEEESGEKALIPHETSVYRLRFDEDGDLWTASADGTALGLSREKDWLVETKLQHPDFVRDIIVEETTARIVTACRDEEVRVWDKAVSSIRSFLRNYLGIPS